VITVWYIIGACSKYESKRRDQGICIRTGIRSVFQEIKEKNVLPHNSFSTKSFGSVIRPKSVSFLRIWGWDWRTGTGQKAKTGKH
jgi:hypothetical protein